MHMSMDNQTVYKTDLNNVILVSMNLTNTWKNFKTISNISKEDRNFIA